MQCGGSALGGWLSGKLVDWNINGLNKQLVRHFGVQRFVKAVDQCFNIMPPSKSLP
jgi:hypothetical protein